MWVAFGTGKHLRYVHINAVCSALGKQKSMALPFSGFFGKRKTSAWEAWKSFPEVTRAFLMDPHAPLFVECEHFKLLERFCIVIYDRTSTSTFYQFGVGFRGHWHCPYRSPRFSFAVHCPTISFWTWNLLINPIACVPNACLIGSMSTMLQQSILCRGNRFHCLAFLEEQLFSCLVDRIFFVHARKHIGSALNYVAGKSK